MSTTETLRINAETYHDQFPSQGYGVSAWSYPEADEDEAARMMPTNHRHYRRTTAGSLRAAGFSLARGGRYGHVTIKLPGELTDTTLESLRDCLSEPRIRPQYREDSDDGV